MTDPRFLVGVDVGGTFTDVFFVDLFSGQISTAKVPSIRGSQELGIISGISENVGDFADLSTVIHGTTVGTNALLERKGARTGIITTSGFRDVLEMRRRDRPTTWGMRGTFEPVVARPDRLEVTERTLADGTILEVVDEAEIREAAGDLLQRGCEAVCLFFVNGYANDTNEARAGEILRDVWPSPYVTVATEILPEIREFERLSTATLNAYLQPVVSAYLQKLDATLRAKGFDRELLIVQSNGGVMGVDTAKEFPVRTALSGPAAGVIAASAIAQAAGFDNVITCDMGGTSFDVSLIASGEPELSPHVSIDYAMTIRQPMIEITTIGAGGGSIAWLDRSGLLQVGPESAGSDPGPVCYGQGNVSPTVTDANLVLGRINPDRPIGGKLTRLDVDAARAALETEIATPLNLSIEQAAEAVLKVANAKMAGAIRLVSIERGHDPAKFAAMPFGGGGALHTGALIKDIGLGSALVPRFPGVTSALGCVVADMRHDHVQTVNQLVEQVDAAALMSAMQADTSRLQERLKQTDTQFSTVERQFAFDMLYTGQTHTVSVPVAQEDGELTRNRILTAFNTAYEQAYGRLLEAVPVRIMNYRVAVIGRRPAFSMELFAPPDGNSVEQCRIASREIWYEGDRFEASIYDRLALSTGSQIKGPAILEQDDTTIFIDPGLVGKVDRYGNLVIRKGE